ncbi:MAG: glycerol-3-phosphate 1-O-acyltransferase PlsY [Ilumatobacteraceae bacterium]
MNTVLAVVGVIASYVVGTMPSAIVVARSKGVDITSFGSGNPGASNVGRALGMKWGALVFVLDAAKGAVPVAIALLAADQRSIAYVCGAAAIMGHIFPVTRGFKGGKGIATGGGVLLPLHPPVMIGAVIFWLVAAKVTKKASVASIVVVPLVMVALAVIGTPAWEIAALVGLGALIEVRHLSNIKRLISGTEHAVRRGA